MENIFTTNMDIVLFIYGLAFFVTGAVLSSQLKRKSEFKLAGILWLLAAFCFLQAAGRFLEMWDIIKSGGHTLDLTVSYLRIVAYFCLFEFGLRLFILSISRPIPYYRNLFKALSPWLSFLICVVIVLRFILYPRDLNTNTIIVRYFLNFPGSILAGSGFILYYSFHRQVFDDIKVRKYFLGAAVAFFTYAFLTGFIVPKGSLFYLAFKRVKERLETEEETRKQRIRGIETEKGKQ